jgi:hypothetical protein
VTACRCVLVSCRRGVQPGPNRHRHLPGGLLPWLQHDIVKRARQAYPAIPLTHVIARLPSVLV